MIGSDDLRFFATIALSSSLASAARTLGVTAPAVTQRLQHLEHRVRLRLVDRSHRRLVLTEEGRLMAEQAQRILGDLESLSDLLRLRRGEVSGNLKLVAPLGFGRRYVAPVAARFRLLHPGVTLSLILTDRPWQQQEEAWDLMVHVGELRDSSLLMRHLAPNERVVCAAPAYLARAGTPLAPDDLRAHDCIALRENEEDVTLWRFGSADGEPRANIRIEPVLSSNDGDAVRQWALEGAGIVLRSEWDVADELRAGRLVRLLPDWRPRPADVVALLPQRQERMARTRHFLAMLAASLAPAPWRFHDRDAPATMT